MALTLAAAVTTLISMAGLRIIGSYVRQSHGRVRHMCGLLSALRLRGSFRERVTARPIQPLADQPYRVFLRALAVGGPPRYPRPR